MRSDSDGELVDALADPNGAKSSLSHEGGFICSRGCSFASQSGASLWFPGC